MPGPTITTVGESRQDFGFNTRVQRLIAKYGLAAHLALLAVAPLLLYPFCEEGAIAAVLLWLSLLAMLWMVLEPSMRRGEGLSDSRRRVAREMAHDPLFWILIVLVAFSGVRALNAGIALSYNAEGAVWYISEQTFPLLPGTVDGAGFQPFAASVAFLVLVQACRHSLGRAARHFFVLASAAVAGLVAVISIAALRLGFSNGLTALLSSGDGLKCSSAGFVFGFYLIGGVVALVAVFEQNWTKTLGLVAVAIGGTAAGVVAFAPFHLSVVLIAAALLVLAYALVFSGKTFQPSSLFKIVLIGLASLAVGGLFVTVALPGNAFAERLAALPEFRFFPEGFLKTREALSAIAFKSWVSHLWLGTGVSSFPLDFRIHAQATDWELLPRGAAAVASCWWLLLAERGVIGLALFILPFGFLLAAYVRRLIGGVADLELPHPTCMVAPVLLALFITAGFFDCSPLRTEVLLAMGSLTVISAVSFPRVKRRKNV